MKTTHWLAGGLLAIPGLLNAAQLVHGDWKVDLNPAFPGISACTYSGHRMTLPEVKEPVVRINGQAHRPEVRLTATGPDRAEYELVFEDLRVVLRARVELRGQALHFTIPEVRETGDLQVRTIEIPGLCLIAGTAQDEAALGNFPAASYASEKPEDHDRIGPVSTLALADNPQKPVRNHNARGEPGASYAFVSNGTLAAGLYSNVMEEDLRMILTLEGEGGGRTLAAAPGQWTYREIPEEICPTPTAILVVATDENDDGKVTWQDAALVYRREVPQPYGGESTREVPIAHIAMNFGSQATNPFLRVLDNAKKVWLLTDGLGQRIQFKGFQSEGHDSSHPDYAGNVGRRMGGRNDLNFVMRRGRDFNMRSGVHINAHEYHAEAKWFSPDIVDRSAIGWSWLDESYLTDYRHDSAYGTLYERLDAMREDLPWLDFAYLDVYYGRGWPGWRMHRRTNDLGIVQFTEFPGVMESAVVWNHVANDWTQQIGGKGDRSEIARFVWYSQKDTFKHDPLLRGSNCDGFMGWHAETKLPQTLHSAFNVNLPTKYLQHFDLIRMESDQAWFRGGPRTEVVAGEDGALTSRVFSRDGGLIHSAVYAKPKTRPVSNLAFIPWDPFREEKIYHWNDQGGTSQWDLPASWKGKASAELYRLTDLGRVFVRNIALRNGKVLLEDIAANTPYVLYRETPPALPEMHWGEGGLVRDPGFDSHSFVHWQAEAGGVSIENHAETGQTELIIAGKDAARVGQTIHGLTPGKTYAASVWLSIEGRREAGLSVEPAPARAPDFLDKGAWRILSAPKHYAGDRPRRMFDGDPQTLWHSAEITTENANPLPHDIVIDLGSDHTLRGFVQTARENLHNGAILGYKAAVSMDNRTWSERAAGEFDYSNGTTVTIPFAEPVKARYFRLSATSEVQGRPFTSIAELDLLIDRESAPPSALPAPLRRTVQQTILLNFTDQSSKYLRNWHRVKVPFTAPADGCVRLVLHAADGAGRICFDDVRLVESGISSPPDDPAGKVVLFEDFENVDEGWGPFLYAWEGPMNTHLSEANPPFTQDVIEGEFSLKSRREGAPDLVYRTVPATLALEPGKSYQVTFDYLCDTPDAFAFAVGRCDPEKERHQVILSRVNLYGGEWTKLTFTHRFTAGEDAFLGITKLDKDKPGTIVIDNLLVTE